MTKGELDNINLDCYTDPSELDKVIEELLPLSFVGVTTLIVYAVNKREAMKYRLAGKIQQAMAFEQVCDDDIYWRLPEKFRW